MNKNENNLEIESITQLLDQLKQWKKLSGQPSLWEDPVWQTIEKKLFTIIEEFQQRDKDLHKELELASRIQEGSLPPLADNWEGIFYNAHIEPMDQVSGDFFDVIKGKNFNKIIIADASGHGIPAALVTMAAKETFHVPQSSKLSPKDFLREVNEEICKRITTQDYLTGFVLHFLNSQDFIYANGGHHPVFLMRFQERQLEALDTRGSFIGALPEAGEFFSEARGRLQPGDKLIMYTDGLIEQTDKSDMSFGLDRLKSILFNSFDLPGHELLNTIVKDFTDFRNNASLTDDVTVIVVELKKEFLLAQQAVKEGRKLLREGKYEEALMKGEYAKNLVSYLPESNYLIAVALYKLERFHDSLPFFDAFLKKIQFRMRTVGPLYWDALVKVGHLEQAIDFGRSIVHEKMSPIFYEQLGQLAKSLGKNQIVRIVMDKLEQK